jgi:1,4-dihydroxy-2-naphthoate octaprenyltransferase
VFAPLAAGAFLLCAYTHPLKGLGLGELAVLVVWGPLMVGGSFLVASGDWSHGAALAGTVYALAPTAVIFGKHIDKAAFDASKSIGTLPVRLGAARARSLLIAIVLLEYAGVASLVLAGLLPWTALSVLLAAASAARLVAVCRREPPLAAPLDFPPGVWPLWYSAFAFAHARSFGLCLLAGVAVDLLAELPA